VEAKSASRLPRQSLELTGPEPRPDGQLALLTWRRASHQKKHSCWVLSANEGRMLFSLRLPRDMDLEVTLHMALAGKNAVMEFLKDLADEVLEDIKDRVKETWRELTERSQYADLISQERVRFLEEQVRALDAYSYLHQLQIQPAFRGGKRGTLQEM